MSDNDRRERVASAFTRHRRDRGTPCSASADILQISSVGVTLMSARYNGPICNSDELSSALDELQFSLGEGPSLDAFTQREVVTEPDLGNGHLERWPVFRTSALEHGTRGVFALPLNVGTKCIGVLTLYRDVAGALSPEQEADSLVVADAVALSMMNGQSRTEADPLAVELGDATSHRAEVHQASGMIAVQLGLPIEDAEARLRAHAYAVDRSVVEIAREVVERRLRLIDDGPVAASGEYDLQ